MKIRIEGCTQEEVLASGVDYLTVGKEYEGEPVQDCDLLHQVIADDGLYIETIVGGKTAHLPDGARWVEVSE